MSTMTTHTKGLIDLLAALDKSATGCINPAWTGQENGNGVGFGSDLDAAIAKARAAVTLNGANSNAAQEAFEALYERDANDPASAYDVAISKAGHDAASVPAGPVLSREDWSGLD